MTDTRPSWSPLAGFVPVFAWGLRYVIRWKKVLILGAAAVGIGALFGIEIGDTKDPELQLARVLDKGVLAFGLPLIALLLASDGFAYEVSSRTLVYHLVRPVSRTTLFLARFAAGWIPATLVGFAFLTAIIASSAVSLPASAWVSLCVTAAAAALALGAVFYVVSALFRHGLVIGLVYAFVVEGFISNVPGSMQRFSVMFQVRSLFHGLLGGALPEVPSKSRGSLLFGTPTRVEDTDPTTAAIVLLVVTAVVLGVGAWRVARRDFGLRE